MASEKGGHKMIRKAITLLAVGALLAVCVAQAAPAPLVASVGLELVIQEYVWIDIQEDSLDMTVTAAMFPLGEQKVYDSSLVLAAVNCDAEIECPKTVALNGGDPYTVDAAINLTGDCAVSGLDDYWYVQLTPGVYDGVETQHIMLWVSIERDWDPAEDPAGTYTGTITLTIYPEP